MNKIFTLCIGAIMLFNTPVFSQTINEHFENDSAALDSELLAVPWNELCQEHWSNIRLPDQWHWKLVRAYLP